MTNHSLDAVPWWEIRLARNAKPVSYACPLCGKKLPALSEHMLMLPEGRPAGRRHAHTECVLAARRAERLLSRSEWLAVGSGERPPTASGRAASALRRTLGAWRSRRGGRPPQ